MGRSVYQYEQPRCPDNWNEAERRFYNRLIETLDDIYSKYGRLDEKMLSKGVLNRIDNSTATSLEKMTTDILSAGKITADSIEATFAYLVSLSAKYGSFDFETVKNLVADAMVLEKGQADYVHITNLAATYAQAVNATIGNLVIQSSDGKYYQLDVSADGKVSAKETTVTDGEIAAGETSGGKVIVGTHITAETLGTATLAATQALINMIDASRINVDTLVAREEFVQTLTANEAFVDSLVANTAFIKQLGTATIVGDTSIEMIVNRTESANKVYRQEDAPPSTENVNPGDLWVIPGTEQMYQAEIPENADVQFYIGSDGALYFTCEDENVSFEIQDFDLYISGLYLNIGSDGTIGEEYQWAHVQDRVLADEIIANREAFERVLRLDDAGLHIGDNKTDNEVLIDSESVNIVVKTQRYSKFAAEYVQFGNYKIGLAEDGGLMFKPM